MAGLKKCQNFSETLKFLSFLVSIQTLTISYWFWRLRNTVRIDTNRFYDTKPPKLNIFEIEYLKTWKSQNLEEMRTDK